MQLPRSTYYYRSTAALVALDDGKLVALIRDIQDEFAGYGYRRVTLELRARGYVVNHKRIARLMREHDLHIKPPRRFVRTGAAEEDPAVFPNLYCNAIPTMPNRVWVADITYIRVVAGFVFLAAILDAFSRKVVGYAFPRRSIHS